MKKTTIIILTFIFLISLTIIPGYKQESIMTSKKEVKSAIAKNEIYYDIKFNKKN